MPHIKTDFDVKLGEIFQSERRDIDEAGVLSILRRQPMYVITDFARNDLSKDPRFDFNMKDRSGIRIASGFRFIERDWIEISKLQSRTYRHQS